MNVAEALRDAARRLAGVSDTARLDAELLMAHALGVTRSRLLLDCSGHEAPDAFAGLVARRAGYEPVAYIVGAQEFYGRPFIVTRDVLIPRADSECVIEAALTAAPEARRILDCGSGSGALLLTLLAELPAATGAGIDRSDAALAIGRANADALGLTQRADFVPCDWTQSGWARDLGTFDLVVANPPYVEDAAELDPSVRAFEPAGALFAGADGLADYRLLIPQLPELLEPGGTAILEIGAAQAPAVSHIAADSGFSAQLRRDLGGRDRALVLEIALGSDGNRG